MSELLSFPGLGLEINLNRVALELGPITIYWYGILAATGIMLGLLYALKRSNEFGLSEDDITDIFLFGAIGGIIGARAYFVIFSWDNYKDNLRAAFEIWNGGIAIYGAIIGSVAVGYFMAKRRKIPFLALTDVAFTSFILGQSIGRWGNFVNIEAFGSNTSMPWGMTSDSIVNYLSSKQEELALIGVAVDPNMPVHPTFFYESVWCFIGFILIAIFTKKRKFDGEITLFYCVWYGAERAVVEGLRTDSLMLGGIRVSQMLSAAAVVVALYIWYRVRMKIKKSDTADYLIPYGHSAEYKNKLIAGILDAGGDSDKIMDMAKALTGNAIDKDLTYKEVSEEEGETVKNPQEETESSTPTTDTDNNDKEV